MKKDIKKIIIKNAFFESNVLDIFNDDKENVSLVYGSNGTGKTTIGRAFLYLKNQDENREYVERAELLDGDSNPIILSEDEKSRIYVFNEDFIERQVEFKSVTSDGRLNSIVMFGKNIENDGKIQNLREKIKEKSENIKNLFLDKYEDHNDPLSPKKYYEQIKKQASLDWAEEEKEFRELTNRAPVKDELLDRIISTDFSKKFDISVYNEKKSNLKKLSGKNPQPILDEALRKFNLDFKNVEIKNNLSKRFNKPVGSDIIEKISKTVSEKSLTRLSEIKDSFGDGYCPFCFRDIDKDYVNHIIEEINKIQSTEVKDHIENLEKLIIPEVELNTNSFVSLDSQLCLEIDIEVKKVNDIIAEINSLIHEKIDNPYDSISDNRFPESNIKGILKKIEDLEQKRILFNNGISNKSKLQRELQELNLQRFAHVVKTLVDNFLKQRDEKVRKETEKAELEKNIKKANEEIDKLNAESKNIGIALSKINEYLGLIFLNKTRIYLEANENTYLVKRGEKPVPIKKLSNGERNAIALCYFFTRINENKSEENIFNTPSLVILDDPLSSFDHNNKIGIYAFLRRIIGEIIKVVNSKIVILTHQIETFFDLSKVSDDLSAKTRTTWLVDKNIQQVNPDKFNLYKRTLNEVFVTIKKPIVDIGLEETENLGNKLRRVLEAFSTFIYGCSIEKLSTDTSITNSMHSNKKVKDYFIDSMYRISLNTTSHLKDRTYSQIDLLTINYFDKEGLIRSAKDVLVLMYLLNDNHMKKMLERYDDNFFKDYIKNIEESI